MTRKVTGKKSIQKKKLRIVYVPVSDYGHPIGEHHHKAKISDADVELMRQLKEQGQALKEINERFPDVSECTIRDICLYKKRATTPARWRKVYKEG